MGFIKNALIGIALYETLKYIIEKNGSAESKTPEQVTLGGKLYHREDTVGIIGNKHRHHLDRPEVGTETETPI